MLAFKFLHAQLFVLDMIFEQVIDCSSDLIGSRYLRV